MMPGKEGAMIEHECEYREMVLIHYLDEHGWVIDLLHREHPSLFFRINGVTHCPFCGEELKPPEPKIEPCPFCGDRSDVGFAGETMNRVMCMRCKASGPLRRSVSDCIDLWNNMVTK
jgi:hypothetical protein